MSNSISGNTGLAGALVTLGGAATANTTADGSGNYTFSGLSAGTYVILCQAAGNTFSPNGSKQTIVSSNITSVNFTATQITPVGVWAKHGVVISNGNSAAEPSVIYEGNAQILSGNVFKMWYLGGGYTSGGIYYAESADGITWTQYSSNPVIASRISGRVFNNGGTYHGYYAHIDFSAIDHYTSSDGIHWTLANSSVVTVGSAGAWDDSQIYNMQVVGQIAGTWYAVYGGNRTDNILCTGVVTSPDLVTWTKSASNPVIYNFSSTNVAYKDGGGTYWAWGDISHYGFGGTLPFEFPTTFGRSSSTDLINWTVPTPSVQPTQTWEALGTGNYQLDSPAVLQYNGQTYMWYAGSPTANAGTNFQIGLAIANASLATLVAGVTAEGVSGTGITLVQHIDNLTFPSTGPITLVYPSNVTQGNLLVTWCEASTTPGTLPTDSMGNTWIAVEPNVTAGYGVLAMAFAIAKSTGANTVTWASNAAQFPGAQAVEFTGNLTTGLDQAVSASGSTGTITSTVLAAAGDLVLASCITGSGATGVTPNSPWLPVNGIAGQQKATAIYKVENSAGNYSPAWTQNPNTDAWGTISMSFGGTYPPIGANVYSQPDCRNYGNFPNLSVNVNGTLTYTKPSVFSLQYWFGTTFSRTQPLPVDSRAAGAPVASNVAYPQNSRTPGTFGPGE